MLTRTTTQLLESLRDSSNDELWCQFDDRYRPVIRAFAIDQGLSEEDAAEVAQVTLTQFSADYRAGRYQRERGRLSSWIIGIARNRIIDAARARQKRAALRGDSALEAVPELANPDEAWRAARQRVILDRAMQRLRTDSKMSEHTLRAFELCAIRGVPPETAAGECGMSVAEVYVAKNRAIKRLREMVAEMTQEFDGE